MNDHEQPNPVGPDQVIVASGNATLPALQASSSAEMRPNLSLQLLVGAANISKQVWELEVANTGKPMGAFFDNILGASCSCVVTCVAAAEAYINEIYVDRKTWCGARDQLTLDLLWSEIERKSIIEKYGFAGQLLQKPPLDWSRGPMQSFAALVRLRNGIVHFIPEWPSEATAHDRLSTQLTPFLTPCEWLGPELLFPRRWASHGSTEWAVKTVVSFVSAFSTHTGIADRFARHREGPTNDSRGTA